MTREQWEDDWVDKWMRWAYQIAPFARLAPYRVTRVLRAWQ